ncbi:mannose-1-phosphate guanylyltransferase/mannose-6-phosphate isomerase [Pseudoalteromonas sp. T1lg21]|uniref:mannose-1-phosphate guanylyltransferase/mannose-6-phosphate isomerase n=1 Tax=Pseudoalteromonas sp. T1lg21 TaxID=2077095 RepID=UPI0018F86593|nr:mannose-1-phosphate guanylyltransferase/mannose-6-phosphate isomerase [Pseudoalteromonas sp. T1lg21]
MSRKITPVILAGGIGSRLWPLSRKAMPKQFLSLLSEKSLLQSTLLRVADSRFNAPILVCNEEHRFIAKAQIAEITDSFTLLLEPEGKNTAPAIALAAEFALQNGLTDPLLVMPADHHISDFDKLIACLDNAIAVCQQQQLVTFAITPTEPHTGYGYIRQGEPLAHEGCFKVAEFKEKPALQLAKKYLASGDYSWNSGMFLFLPDVYLSELTRFAPKIADSVAKAASFTADLGFQRPVTNSLAACPSDSIDYAILERSANVAVIPVDLNWSDVGSFSALSKIAEKDHHGNYLASQGVSLDSENNLLISEADHTIAALGVSNQAIIHTHDATLVADKSALDKLPDLLKQLALVDSDKLTHHQAVFRPWGNYRTLIESTGFKVKKIIVNRGAKLSTQRHQHRAEHWVVVSGVANVRVGDNEFELTADQSCYIAAKQLHSLANQQNTPLIVIEVQTGAILDESDIERFDDRYGRD